MTDRLMRREQVEQRTGLARTTIYRKMRDGSFPQPIRVGVRAVRWPSSEIEAWLASRPRATGEPTPPKNNPEEARAVARGARAI